MAKTNFPVGGRNQSGLLTQYTHNAPVGNIFWVSSVTGSTSNSGYTPQDPLATIDAAIGLCTASNGDVIKVLPGHAENITAATSINCDVAGITIEGIGEGAMKPTISTTAAAGSVTIGAANVTIKNLRFVANFETGTTTAITVAATGDGFIMDGCDFRDTSATFEFLIHVSVATTVTDMVIKNCTFITAAGSMTNSILFAGTSINCVVDGCYFFVDSSDDVIDHLTAASVNFVVKNCTIINQDTDAAGYCLRYKSDGTGVAANNFLAYNKVDAEVGVGAAAWWFQNFATNTIGSSSGVLDPAAGAAVP